MTAHRAKYLKRYRRKRVREARKKRICRTCERPVTGRTVECEECRRIERERRAGLRAERRRFREALMEIIAGSIDPIAVAKKAVEQP